MTHTFTEVGSGPDYVSREDLEETIDERDLLTLRTINALWREVVWLRALLGLTGVALFLVTLAVAFR